MVKRLFLLLMCAGLLAVGCKMETDNGNVSAPSGNGQPDSGDKIILHSPLGYVYISGTGNPDIDYEILAMSSAGDGWYQYIIEASSAEIFFLIADDNWENTSPVFYVTEGEWWYDRATGEMVDTKPELNDDAGGSGDISFLPAPEEVTATYSEQDGSIFLFWTPVPGAISYEIFYNTINAFENADSLDDLADYYTYITGAEAGVTYYFWIKAKNGTVVSDFSTYAQCRVPQKETLAAPTGVRATAISTDTVQVFWNPAEGASSYRIYYSTSNNTAYAQYTTAGGSSVYVSGLNSGTGYYFWVKSVGTSEISDFSLVSYAVTQEEKPTNLNAPQITNIELTTNENGLRITWNAVPGATSYKIYRSSSKYASRIEIATNIMYTAYDDIDVDLKAVGAGYYYSIKAVSSDGVESSLNVPRGITVTAPQVAVSLSKWAISTTSTGATRYCIPRSAELIIGNIKKTISNLNQSASITSSYVEISAGLQSFQTNYTGRYNSTIRKGTNSGSYDFKPMFKYKINAKSGNVTKEDCLLQME